MKKILYYFDNKVKKIFIEKENEQGEKKVMLSSRYNFVAKNEIVARVINVEFEEEIEEAVDKGYKYYNVVDFKVIKVKNGVFYDDATQSYRASEYGFIVCNNYEFKLLPLLSVTKDKLKGTLTIFPTKFGIIPNKKDVYEILHDTGIVAQVDESQIDSQLAKIDPLKPKLSRIILARGKAPVLGNKEYFIPIISIEKKAGEVLSDGSMDFKEVGSIIQVNKGDEIVKRVPMVRPVPGFDIYGDKIEGEEEVTEERYKRGKNIDQSGKDENVFVSAIDGCLIVENKKISVLPVAVITGDINYDTGNIDFNGSVHVTGSVLPGFYIKATGDIIVEGTVEDATIESDGDITIKMGVVGKESVKLLAGGNVIAKYLLNAKVEAGGNITVEDSIINCDVFSNNKINVIAQHGKIIGGKSTALYEIVVNEAGATNETETVLSVGRNLFIEKEMEKVKIEITKWSDSVAETMRLIKVNFGEGVFADPKGYIAILPPVKKKKCVGLLQELSEGNKKVKELNVISNQILEKLKLDSEPFIKIIEKVNPGTVLYIKKSVKKIEQVATNVKYYEDPEERAIRFTSAI